MLIRSPAFSVISFRMVVFLTSGQITEKRVDRELRPCTIALKFRFDCSCFVRGDARESKCRC